MRRVRETHKLKLDLSNSTQHSKTVAVNKRGGKGKRKGKAKDTKNRKTTMVCQDCCLPSNFSILQVLLINRWRMSLKQPPILGLQSAYYYKGGHVSGGDESCSAPVAFTLGLAE